MPILWPIFYHLLFLFPFQAGRNIRDLFEDLRDGHNLLSLLEVLSGEILVSIHIDDCQSYKLATKDKMFFLYVQN